MRARGSLVGLSVPLSRCGSPGGTLSPLPCWTCWLTGRGHSQQHQAMVASWHLVQPLEPEYCGAWGVMLEQHPAR